MWSIDVNDASCYDYGGLGLQSLVESLIFFHIKKGSNSSRSNFKPLGSLCFTSFDHWMRFMVNGRYQWHQNEWFFSENTQNLLPSSPFFSFPFFDKKEHKHITMLFIFNFGWSCKKRKKKSQTRKQLFHTSTSKKKGVSVLCVSPNVPSAALHRPFVRFVPSPRPWMTCTCSSPPIRRPPRARQNDGVNWGWRCRGENVPWYASPMFVLSRDKDGCTPAPV